MSFHALQLRRAAIDCSPHHFPTHTFFWLLCAICMGSGLVGGPGSDVPALAKSHPPIALLVQAYGGGVRVKGTRVQRIGVA